MPHPTYEEYSQAIAKVLAKYGITELPETAPPSTTTIDIIMRQRRADSPASSDEAPEERDATSDNARRPS